MIHDFIRDLIRPAHAHNTAKKWVAVMDKGEPIESKPNAMHGPPYQRWPRVAIALHCTAAVSPWDACATRDPASGAPDHRADTTGHRPLFVTSHDLLTSPARRHAGERGRRRTATCSGRHAAHRSAATMHGARDWRRVYAVTAPR